MDWYEEENAQDFLGCINVSPFKFSKKSGNIPKQSVIDYWNQISKEQKIEEDKLRPPPSDYEKVNKLSNG